MGLRMMQGWVLSAGLVLGTLAWADDSRGCIDVQVGQTRALAYDCLTRQLQGTEGQRAARANREAMRMDVSKRPSNQLGLFNQSATGQRMGNAFGVSVHPQRPGS